MNEKQEFHILFSLYATFIFSLAILFFIIRFFFNGIDLLDESYYLTSIANPFAYDATASQFGYFYYLFFKLVDQNIVYLRIINFLLIFISNFVLSYLVLKLISDNKYSLNNFNVLIICLALATISLTIYNLWIPTPNYNFLAYLSLSITAIGVLINEIQRKFKTLTFLNNNVCWLIIGFGGWLAFMAKPTTALGLAVVVLAWSIFSGNFKLKEIVVSIITALLLLFITAFVIDGSIGSFINRYEKAIALENISKVHGVAKLITFNIFETLQGLSLNFYLVCIILFICGLTLAYLVNKKNKSLNIIFIIVSICAFTVFNLIYSPRDSNNFAEGHFIWFMPLGIFLYQIASKKYDSLTSKRNTIVLILFFLSLSIVYGLGSNNLLAITTSLSSYFIFIGFLILICGLNKEIFLLTSVVNLTLLIFISIIISTWYYPYRQFSNLWKQTSSIEFPINGGKINLDSHQATFFALFYDMAQKEGFVPGTPVIDLTGRLPGLIYSINGILPRTPWLFSDYPGSDDYALNALNKLTCEELVKSWIIMPTISNFPTLNHDLPLRAGIPTDSQFASAGSFPLPFNFKNLTGKELQIFRPQDSGPLAIKACEAQRKEGIAKQ
jgi:hypothetical protein